jgi:hypothetical protein
MKTSVKIIEGKKGYHLQVNGLFINQAFENDIKAITCKFGVPYGATEWESVQALKAFWHKYMSEIIASTKTPYKSVWGQLEFIKL